MGGTGALSCGLRLPTSRPLNYDDDRAATLTRLAVRKGLFLGDAHLGATLTPSSVPNFPVAIQVSGGGNR
jgi:hypothetical protein